MWKYSTGCCRLLIAVRRREEILVGPRLPGTGEWRDPKRAISAPRQSEPPTPDHHRRPPWSSPPHTTRLWCWVSCKVASPAADNSSLLLPRLYIALPLTIPVLLSARTSWANLTVLRREWGIGRKEFTQTLHFLADNMELFYYMVFGCVGAVVAALELSKTNKDRINTSSAFDSFKNNYLLVYSLMMGNHTGSELGRLLWSSNLSDLGVYVCVCVLSFGIRCLTWIWSIPTKFCSRSNASIDLCLRIHADGINGTCSVIRDFIVSCVRWRCFVNQTKWCIWIVKNMLTF